MSSTTKLTPEIGANKGNGTARTLRAVPDLADKTATRTEAEDKLWKALHTNPDHSAAELAAIARIGKSTAGKILAKWVKDGNVQRATGTVDGARRTADTWTVAELDDADSVQSAEPNSDKALPASTHSSAGQEVTVDNRPVNGLDDSDAAAPGATKDAVTFGESTAAGGAETEKEARLAPGALRGMVEDYLRDHPGDEFGPGAIAKALGGKSAGAVSNALDKLVADKTVVKTKESPKRFAVSPTE